MSVPPAVISYPGVGSCLSVVYTASLGITPGVAAVEALLGDTAPAVAGDLTFGETDPATGLPLVTLTLAGCRLDRVTGGYGAGGNRVRLFLLDRRWRWQLGRGLRGHYNQLDRRGKLVPWSVRSPFQLAVMLLEAMGEPEPAAGWDTVIDLPAGLAAAADAALGIPAPGPLDELADPVADYLGLDENLPPTGTNPAVQWADEPAAVLLARLCDEYGRAVCFDPASDAVSVVRLGSGGGLPDGAVDVRQEGLDPAEAPEAVRVVGSPTRYQVRLAFRAVGRDWDGSWRPLDELSYAPGDPGDTDRWAACPPPLFPRVKATDRLTYQQAVALARETVFRCYQLVEQDPADPETKAVPVPGLDPDPETLSAPVDNRFRLVLLATRPEQTAPRPADVARIDPATGRPFAREFYDGYSQDRPPQAFGSVHLSVYDGAVWAARSGFDADGNSPAHSPFYVPFQIADPERQVVAFARPVYRVESGAEPGDPPASGGAKKFRPAPVVIETGVMVLDEATLDPVRHEVEAEVPGGTGPVRNVRVEQVQRDVIGEYADDHTLTNWRENDAYADAAGAYYADAVAATYQLVGAATNTYVGFVPVSLSGRVRQATWTVSDRGRVTTASLDTEHSPAVPPYPARRKAENLPPDPQEAFLNSFGAGAGAVWRGANAVGRFVSGLLGSGGGRG